MNSRCVLHQVRSDVSSEARHADYYRTRLRSGEESPLIHVLRSARRSGSIDQYPYYPQVVGARCMCIFSCAVAESLVSGIRVFSSRMMLFRSFGSKNRIAVSPSDVFHRCRVPVMGYHVGDDCVTHDIRASLFRRNLIFSLLFVNTTPNSTE